MTTPPVFLLFAALAVCAWFVCFSWFVFGASETATWSQPPHLQTAQINRCTFNTSNCVNTYNSATCDVVGPCTIESQCAHNEQECFSKLLELILKTTYSRYDDFYYLFSFDGASTSTFNGHHTIETGTGTGYVPITDYESNYTVDSGSIPIYGSVAVAESISGYTFHAQLVSCSEAATDTETMDVTATSVVHGECTFLDLCRNAYECMTHLHGLYRNTSSRALSTTLLGFANMQRHRMSYRVT